MQQGLLQIASRSTFLHLVILVVAANIPTSVFAGEVIPCAIRWDAWYNPTSSSLNAQESLAPADWRSRAPKHCTIATSAAVRCVGTQAVIDEEIRAATDLGGLSCWAFVKYTQASSLSTAWRLFQFSKIKERINWTWITSLALFVPEKDRPQPMAELIGDMRQSNYQKVDVIHPDRPVLFLLWSEQEFTAAFHGDYGSVKRLISDLAAGAEAVGLGKPYVVILRGIPERAAEIARNVGADAIGSYSIPLTPNRVGLGSFDSLSKQTRSFWSKLTATSVPIVPTIMTGFDQRPAVAHPREPQSLKNEPEVFYSVATDDQLSTEARDVAKFIIRCQLCFSRLLLVYAWNENSEGGGALNETLGDPNGDRLRAFRRGFAAAR
jgi:hypothetical protein